MMLGFISSSPSPIPTSVNVPTPIPPLAATADAVTTGVLSNLDTLLSDGNSMDVSYKDQATNELVCESVISPPPPLTRDVVDDSIPDSSHCLPNEPLLDDPNPFSLAFQQELELMPNDYQGGQMDAQESLPITDSPLEAQPSTAHSPHSPPVSLQQLSVLGAPPSSVLHSPSSVQTLASRLNVPLHESPSIHFSTPILRSGDSSLVLESNSPLLMQASVEYSPVIHHQRQTSSQFPVASFPPTEVSPVKRKHSPETIVANKRTKSLTTDDLTAVGSISSGTTMVLAPRGHSVRLPQTSTTIELIPHRHPSARRRLPFAPVFDENGSLPMALLHSNKSNTSNQGIQQHAEQLPASRNDDRRHSVSVVASSSVAVSPPLPPLVSHGRCHSMTLAMIPTSIQTDRQPLVAHTVQPAQTSLCKDTVIPTLPPIAIHHQPANANYETSTSKYQYTMPPSNSIPRITFTCHCVVCKQTFVSESKADKCCSNAACAVAFNRLPKPKKARKPTISSSSVSDSASLSNSQSLPNKSKPLLYIHNKESEGNTDASSSYTQQKPTKKRVVKKLENQPHHKRSSCNLATASGRHSQREARNCENIVQSSPPAALMGLAVACGSPMGDASVQLPSHSSEAVSRVEASTEIHQSETHLSNPRSRSNTHDSSFSTSSSVPHLNTDVSVGATESAATTPRIHYNTPVGNAQRNGFASSAVNTSMQTGTGIDFGSFSPHHFISPRDMIFRQQDSHFSFMDSLSPEPSSVKLSSNYMVPKPILHEYTHPILPTDDPSPLHPRRDSFSTRFTDEEELDDNSDDYEENRDNSEIERGREKGRRRSIKHERIIYSDDDEEEDDQLEVRNSPVAVDVQMTSSISTPSSNTKTPIIAPLLPTIASVTSGLVIPALTTCVAPGSAPTTPMSKLHFSSTPTTIDTTLLPSPGSTVLSRLQLASMNQAKLKQQLKNEGKMSDIESNEEEQEQEQEVEQELVQTNVNQSVKREHTQTQPDETAKSESESIVEPTSNDTLRRRSRSNERQRRKRRLKKRRQADNGDSDKKERSVAAVTSEEDEESSSLKKVASALERASRINRRNSLSEEREAAQANLLPVPSAEGDELPAVDTLVVHTCELCQHRFSESYGGGRFCGARCARQFSINKRWKRT